MVQRSDLTAVIGDMLLEPRVVYYYLVERAEADPKVGLTQQELSRQTGLSLDRVRSSLKWLTENDLIKITKGKNHYLIRLLEPYHEEVKIPFTYDDTDDMRLATLEREVLRQAGALKQSKSLSSVLNGERAQIIGEIERASGGLSLVEAYMLGQAVALVGPERLKIAWRTKAHEMKNPIRGVCSMLLNKAYGKHIQREETPEVVYRKFKRED